MFIRRQLYDKTGLYDTNFRISMDFELYCRISKSFNNVESIHEYIREVPIVIMNAGGVSWNLEMNSIIEIKKALMLHNYWNFNGKKFFFLRAFKTKFKGLLTVLNLNFIIKLWRNFKWR